MVHKALENMHIRILDTAKGALAQANTHAVYFDPGREHWDQMSILNAALAGELFLKAIIAKEHPLLIFRDLFHLDDSQQDEMDVAKIIEKGKTYNFDTLPKLLWVTTGERIADPKSFEQIRRVRNSIQHFCVPENIPLRRLSLDFIYKNVDPLINKYFGLYAIEYHEEMSIGYDYVVNCLVGCELIFSVPDNFEVSEIDLEGVLSKTRKSYQKEMRRKMEEKGYIF